MSKRSDEPVLRVLAACTHCATQYDVTGQTTGASVRCRCGTVIIVPQARVQDARLVRCGSCGGSRGKGGENCEFCGARFSSIDKGWGSMCPGCFARLPSDAGFCVECGLKINPQSLDAVRSDLKCPRCTAALQGRTVASIELFECASCAGIWLGEDAFATIVEVKDSRAQVLQHAPKKPRLKFELDPSEEVKYVPCPLCKNLMNRRNFGRVSGVITDVCRDHGVWLDNKELNRIVAFIEAGGLNRKRELDQLDREHAKNAGKHTTTMLPLGGDGPLSMRNPGSSPFAPVLAEVVWTVARLLFKL